MIIDKVYFVSLNLTEEFIEDMISRLNYITVPNETEWECIEPVNGKIDLVTIEDRKKLGVTFYKDWKLNDDIFWNRDVTVGEAGCTLSHIRVWLDAYENGYDKILVLEEDFRPINPINWSEFDVLGKYDYDFLYLGRKLRNDIQGIKDLEIGLDNFVMPGASFNTQAYIITRQGIEKIIKHNLDTLMNNMIVVDEFLMSTYTSHPREDIRNMYIQNMFAISSRTQLIGQTRYPHAGNSQTEPIEGIDF
jgi:hypothetical protein